MFLNNPKIHPRWMQAGKWRDLCTALSFNILQEICLRNFGMDATMTVESLEMEQFAFGSLVMKMMAVKSTM